MSSPTRSSNLRPYPYSPSAVAIIENPLHQSQRLNSDSRSDETLYIISNFILKALIKPKSHKYTIKL